MTGAGTCGTSSQRDGPRGPHRQPEGTQVPVHGRVGQGCGSDCGQGSQQLVDWPSARRDHPGIGPSARGCWPGPVLHSRDLYLAHGYVLQPDAPFLLPDGGPRMWPMWRQPRVHTKPV